MPKVVEVSGLEARVDGYPVRATGIARLCGLLALRFEGPKGRPRWIAAERVTVNLPGRGWVFLDELFDSLPPAREEPEEKVIIGAYHRSYGPVDVLQIQGRQVRIRPQGWVDLLEDEDRLPVDEELDGEPVQAPAPREIWVDQSELVQESCLRYRLDKTAELDSRRLWVAQPLDGSDPVEGFLEVLAIVKGVRYHRRTGRPYRVSQAVCRVAWDEDPTRIGRLQLVDPSWLVRVGDAQRLSYVRGEWQLPEDQFAGDLGEPAPEEPAYRPASEEIRRIWDQLLPARHWSRRGAETQDSLGATVLVDDFFPAPGVVASVRVHWDHGRILPLQVVRRGRDLVVVSERPLALPIRRLVVRKTLWRWVEIELIRSRITGRKPRFDLLLR